MADLLWKHEIGYRFRGLGTTQNYLSVEKTYLRYLLPHPETSDAGGLDFWYVA
jgi:hypothetical protein